MMHPVSFRLNQYNWLGQKFLCQHRYGEAILLRDRLSYLRAATNVASDEFLGDQAGLTRDGLRETTSLVSSHLSYIYGLALMKTSTNLNELIVILQKLNFQKNNQYFLLLCQCLFYLGDYDAVVALCRQMFNKEINVIPDDNDDNNNNSKQEWKTQSSDSEDTNQAAQLNDEKLTTTTKPAQIQRGGHVWDRLHESSEESVEFSKIFQSVNQNRLINDPRLWHIFALSLRLQLKFGDADLAHRMACKLMFSRRSELRSSSVLSMSGGQGREQPRLVAMDGTTFEREIATYKDQIGGDHQIIENQPAGLSSYSLSHSSYAEFCINYRGDDFKTALQTLMQATQNSPIDYELHPLMALILCCQTNSNSNHFSRAIDIVSTIDAHTESSMNPSFAYNQLALRCYQKLLAQQQSQPLPLEKDLSSMMTNTSIPIQYNQDSMELYAKQTIDELRSDLNYLLIKSHIFINNWIQNCSTNNPKAYKCSFQHTSEGNGIASSGNKSTIGELDKQIDRLIESLKGSNSNCWSSSALWNNLGLCYLLKHRYIASLTCLSKAQLLNPLDWRIQYNLALAHMHVGLFHRAICNLNAAQRIYGRNHKKQLRKQQMWSSGAHKVAGKQLTLTEPFTQMLLAICYSELAATYQSRRLHAELMVQMKNLGPSGRTLVTPIVNYLLFLISHQTDQYDQKLIIRLLEFLEQGWLQRNQNDAQFSLVLLDIARLIGDRAASGESVQTRKVFAWTKVL